MAWAEYSNADPQPLTWHVKHEDAIAKVPSKLRHPARSRIKCRELAYFLAFLALIIRST